MYKTANYKKCNQQLFPKSYSLGQKKKSRLTFGTEREFAVGCFRKQVQTHRPVILLLYWKLKPYKLLWCIGWPRVLHIYVLKSLFLFSKYSQGMKTNITFTGHKNKYHLHWSFFRVTVFLVLNRLLLSSFKVNEVST